MMNGKILVLGLLVAALLYGVVDVDAASVSIGDVFMESGSSGTVSVVLGDVVNFGAGDILLSYNPSVVEVVDVVEGNISGSVMAGNINNTAGFVRVVVYGVDNPGPCGDFTLFNVVLLAVGSPGESSVLDLSVMELADAEGVLIEADVVDGVFTVLGVVSSTSTTTTSSTSTTSTTVPGTTTTSTTVPGTTTTSTTVPGTTTTSTTVPGTTTSSIPSPPPSTTTSTSSTTSTTVIWPCELPGDYPVCGEVTLGEVVDYISLWSEGSVDLSDLINLVNAWIGGTACDLLGDYPPFGGLSLGAVVNYIVLWLWG